MATTTTTTTLATSEQTQQPSPSTLFLFSPTIPKIPKKSNPPTLPNPQHINPTTNSLPKPTLQTLPPEILRQILLYSLTLSASLYTTKPPTGHLALPYPADVPSKPLIPIIPKSRLVTNNILRKKPQFWGKEPMTRLMRVSALFYEHTWDIIWGSGIFHVAEYRWARSCQGIEPGNGREEWIAWLKAMNPRALERIRHLHIRICCSSGSCTDLIDREVGGVLGFVGNFGGVGGLRVQVGGRWGGDENRDKVFRGLLWRRLDGIVEGVGGGADVCVFGEDEENVGLVGEWLEERGRRREIVVEKKKEEKSGRVFWPEITDVERVRMERRGCGGNGVVGSIALVPRSEVAVKL